MINEVDFIHYLIDATPATVGHNIRHSLDKKRWKEIRVERPGQIRVPEGYLFIEVVHRARMRRAVEWAKDKLRRAGAVRTTVVAGGAEVTKPAMPFRRIAQYQGLPVIYPDGSPCYHLPEDVVLHLKGSLKVGENLQAAYVYAGKIQHDHGWPGDRA